MKGVINTDNLTAQPRLDRVKQVLVRLAAGSIGATFIFDYDQLLDNSILKGLRFNPGYYSGTLNGNVTSDVAITGQPSFITKALAANIYVNLIDHDNKYIMKDYPLQALAGYRPRGGAQPHLTIRNNARPAIKKCYLYYNSGITIPAGTVCFVNLSWYYKPI